MISYERILLPPSAESLPESVNSMQVRSVRVDGDSTSQESTPANVPSSVSASSSVLVRKGGFTVRYDVEAETTRRVNYEQSFGMENVSTEK
jgi:hypothetical protein